MANLLGAPGEAGVTLTYALVPGAGSDDNASFTINGSTLLSAVTFNYAVQSTYNIRIGITDSNGMYSDFPFTLYVQTPPIVANAIPNQYVIVPNAFNYTVPANTFADPVGAPLSYSATLADGSLLPAWLSFDPSSSTFSGTPALTDVATLQIIVTASDADNQQVSAPFTLNVYPPTQSAGQGLGLLGAYYNGTNFDSFGFDRIDPQVNFGWGGASPGAPVGETNFTTMWTGQILAPQDGLYTFYTIVDDAAALWVNGQQLFGWSGSNSNTITLQAGQMYDITLEYVQYGGTPDAYLDWSYPGQAQQVIPQSQLYGNPACTLDNTLLSNNWPVGSLVANLLGAPGEAGVTLSYALVPGDGSDDNASFTIDGSTLLSAVTFNYAVQSTYNIRIGVTDSNGMYSEFAFTLYTYTPPTVANPIPDQVVTEPNSYQYIVPGNTFADAQGAALSYSATLADGSPLPAWLTFNPGNEIIGAQLAGAHSTDTTTQGSWSNRYGSNGYVLCDWNGSDVVSLNGSSVQSVTPISAGYYVWASNTNEPRATLNPATNTRSAACWYSGGTFDVNIDLVNPNDGVVHSMAVYCLDWDDWGGGRSQTLDVLNAATGQSELNGGPVAV